MLPANFADIVTNSLEYDGNGNLIKDKDFSYEYNALNELIEVQDSEGNVIVKYFYDEIGQRIKKIENGKTTYYVDKNFVREVEGSSVEDTIYYYDADALVGRKDSEGMFFYHPNHLGSTDIVTDSDGEIVEETKYLPFGEVVSGGDSRYLFTGQEKDQETGLMYYNARYYSPFTRHFTQADTMLPNIYDPQQLNRYSYARNNPLKYVDDSGNSPTLVTALIGVGIGALIGGGISLGTQLYKSGGDFNQVDWGGVGKATAIGAVAGGVAGLTLGLGNAAIGAVGLTGKAALVAEGTVAVTSSVASGQASRAGWNVAEGNDIAAGLGNPTDMAIDGTIGLATWGAFKGYNAMRVKGDWYNSNYLTIQDSLDDHYNRHVLDRGLKMSKQQYYDKSRSFLQRTLDGKFADQAKIKPLSLKDGTTGIKITVGKEMGIYSYDGSTVSYHPTR